MNSNMNNSELFYFNTIKKEFSKLYWEPDLYNKIVDLDNYYKSDEYLNESIYIGVDRMLDDMNIEYEDIIDKDKVLEYLKQNSTLSYATSLENFLFIKKYIYKYKKEMFSKRIKEKINESILFYKNELEIFKSNFIKKFEEGYFLK